MSFAGGVIRLAMRLPCVGRAEPACGTTQFACGPSGTNLANVCWTTETTLSPQAIVSLYERLLDGQEHGVNHAPQALSSAGIPRSCEARRNSWRRVSHFRPEAHDRSLAIELYCLARFMSRATLRPH